MPLLNRMSRSGGRLREVHVCALMAGFKCTSLPKTFGPVDTLSLEMAPGHQYSYQDFIHWVLKG